MAGTGGSTQVTRIDGRHKLRWYWHAARAGSDQASHPLLRVSARRFEHGHRKRTHLPPAKSEMHEKYDARYRAAGAPGGGGEYAPQVGFGWSNGAALDLLKRFGGIPADDAE